MRFQPGDLVFFSDPKIRDTMGLCRIVRIFHGSEHGDYNVVRTDCPENRYWAHDKQLIPWTGDEWAHDSI